MFFYKSDLAKTKLPTKRDVIQYMLHLKDEGSLSVPRNRKLNNYCGIVIIAVCQLWERANIPISEKSTMRRKLLSLLEDHYTILKHPHKYQEAEWDKLFIVSKCKCGVAKNITCKCRSADKIPASALPFFIDQCGSRLLTTDDHPELANDVEMVSFNEIVSGIDQESTFTQDYMPSSGEEQEFELTIPPPMLESQLKVSDISLRNFAMALDRTDTSDRFGALLATMLIKDLRVSIIEKIKKNLSSEISSKIITFFDEIIIDKNKIQRERSKSRLLARDGNNNNSLLKGISYDGKKDYTLKKIFIQNKIRLTKSTEEHITILKEPESKFIGYATPFEGTGEEIQKAIIKFLTLEKFSFDHLVSITCDGTSVNTGYKGGVNVCIERYLQRPLQWNVCLFHFNELPLKALIKHFYGKTKGPGILQGEIGTEILDCERYPIAINFKPIRMGIMPTNIDNWKLRDDQRYLFRMVVAINNGICDENLSLEKPGPISSSRWLTTASRFLRLYVAKIQPTSTLKKIVEFIVKVYAPFWFLVKSQPQAFNGSRHVFKYICWIRQLPIDVRNVICPTIEYNAYYFHPENIILSMITDHDQRIRENGYELIRDARHEPPAALRVFYIPKKGIINFDSNSYIKMIDWNKFKITEPPCLQFLDESELMLYQFSSSEIIKIPDFPCHSQNTERFVRVVSESALAVSDENRLGHIFAKIENRERYSQLESRQDLE